MEVLKNKLITFLNLLFKYNIFIFLVYINISLLFLYKTSTVNLNGLKILLANIFLIISTYILNKISDEEEDKKNNYYFQIKHKQIIFISVTFYILSFLIYLKEQNKVLLIFWILFFLLSIFYSFPKTYRLKKIFLIKNLIPSFCWFFSITIIILNQNNLSLIESIKITYPIFFLSLLIEILWDMPDIQGDKKENIKTIPVYLGFRNTKILLFLFILLIFFYINTPLIKLICLLLLLFIINISKSTKKITYHCFIFILTIIISTSYLI